MQEYELFHYGILGMKWGVRRDRYSDTTASGIRLEKNTIVNRIASQGDEKKRGMKYAAFDPKDVEGYEFMFALGDSKQFNFSYKLTETLVSPNEKRQVDAFLETVSEMSVKQAAATLKTKSKLSTLSGIEKELKKAIDGNVKSRVKTYDKFMDLLYSDELQPIRKEYFNKLSKEGYNMIIDSSDKGVVADYPVLIFNSNRSLSFVSKKKL